jgi:ABC-2 type transport system permease protein
VTADPHPAGPVPAGRRHHPLLELTRARMLEFVREPEAVFWVFVFPVLLAVALGIAFRSRPAERIPVAILTAPDGTAGRPELIARLRESPDLDLQLLDPEAAALALRKSRVDVVVDLAGTPEGGGPVTYRYDAARTEGRAARLAFDDVLQRALGRDDAVETMVSTVTERGSRYIDFLIPGLIGLNLMGSGLWGIGFSVVVSRTKKLLKRFAATPMRRSHYLASFAFSRLLFMSLEVAAILGAGRLIFGVEVRGSLLDLVAVALLGSLSFAGIGLLVAARPRTVEAVSGWMNLVQLPMWLLSGAFFSYERFPEALLPVIRALPLTALNDALRAVMNEGAGLATSALPLAILAGWGLGSFAVAVRIFRWQ